MLGCNYLASTGFTSNNEASVKQDAYDFILSAICSCLRDLDRLQVAFIKLD